MNDFLTAIETSLKDDSFVRLVFGNYAGSETDLKKILIRAVVVKRQPMLGFTYRYKTRDIVKNHAAAEALREVGKYLQNGFGAATLFTTEFDLALETKQGKPLLKKSAPTQTMRPPTDHDRAKNRMIEEGGDVAYLHDLGITDASGKVHKTAQDKFRQINRYVEILDPYLKSIPAKDPLRIADMGSGKGYLTFALYDHLSRNLKILANVTGVEMRADMVFLCNKAAEKSGFSGLSFEENTIEGYEPKALDVLIALHACDTATDDAIHQGIKSNAELIVVAPCCHKQIRKEMREGNPSADLDAVLKHGIFAERVAEMATDTLRALLLEYAGYKTKVFEFISDSHTPKNILIVATKRKDDKTQSDVALKKFNNAKKFFGIREHYLEKKMGL